MKLMLIKNILIITLTGLCQCYYVIINMKLVKIAKGYESLVT
ncbi:protein of unknown function [Tepidibacter aestuarii]|nr:protein of unknown function [Tepidibacter aestuarii]